MSEAYCKLHELGFAHSAECWENDELIGGLYGVSLGSCFFGESMFSRKSNASKMAFITFVKMLQKRGFTLIDCQIETGHLESLGAEGIPRQQFMGELEKALQQKTLRGKWKKPLTSEL